MGYKMVDLRDIERPVCGDYPMWRRQEGASTEGG